MKETNFLWPQRTIGAFALSCYGLLILSLNLWACTAPIMTTNDPERHEGQFAPTETAGSALETALTTPQADLDIQSRMIPLKIAPPPAHQANENPLTGLILKDPMILKRRPLQIRLGNDSQARPQLNLSQADLVYEEIVEWWITRLTAIYYTNTPEIVAPVRSARLINIPLAQQYQAALINSGASDPIRFKMTQSDIIDLDEHFHPSPYFYRAGESWQRRLAVNPQAAHQYLSEQGWQAPVSLRGFAFEDRPPLAQPATRIFIDYPAASSKVEWVFNEVSGKYDRYVAGQAMTDFMTGEKISSDNVIIYFAQHYRTDIVEDSSGATSVGIEINGEGRAWIFRDKVLVTGSWLTDGRQTPLFLNAAGEHLPLRRGRTWIEVVPEDYVIRVN